MKKTSIEGYYVDESGNVYSDMSGKIRQLKPCDNGHGYLIVKPSLDKKAVQKKVHRLVAEAYLSNPDNKPCVNHIDRDRTNSNVSNLEWVTYEENTQHLHSLHPLAKLDASQVVVIKQRLGLGDAVKQLSREFNVTPKNIREIKYGRIWRSV